MLGSLRLHQRSSFGSSFGRRVGWHLLWLSLGVLLASSGGASANDRLPRRVRETYLRGRTEAEKYLRYLLDRVWGQEVARLAAAGVPRAQRSARADSMVDEVVHLVLPNALRYTRAALFGTRGTHLTITEPGSARAPSVGSARVPPAQSAKQAAQEAIAQLGGATERALEDRLEQALGEDLGDLAQQWVEGAVGLPVQGRSRARVRPLPPEWEARYQEQARAQAHEHTYWWLRKRRRTQLSHLAMSSKKAELDRAQHEGPVWGLTSGISQESWAQNRLRLDFKWGRPNWEIDRRNLRRRLDQDLAQATWAMARQVRELTRDGVTRKAKEHLRRRVREELQKAPLREKAEGYPGTRRELEQQLDGLRRELDGIANEATAKVPLPPDMTPPLQELARKHGRRYFREDLAGALGGAISDEAPLHAAHKRARDTLPGHVADAIARQDLGARAGEEGDARRKVLDAVRQEALPKVREDVRDALRASGQDELRPARAGDADEVVRRFELERQLDEEAAQQLEAARGRR